MNELTRDEDKDIGTGVRNKSTNSCSCREINTCSVNTMKIWRRPFPVLFYFVLFLFPTTGKSVNSCIVLASSSSKQMDVQSQIGLLVKVYDTTTYGQTNVPPSGGNQVSFHSFKTVVSGKKPKVNVCYYLCLASQPASQPSISGGGNPNSKPRQETVPPLLFHGPGGRCLGLRMSIPEAGSRTRLGAYTWKVMLHRGGKGSRQIDR